MRNRTRALLVSSAGLALTLGLAACAPGSGSGSGQASGAPASTDVAKAGQVTLTEWDQDTDPVRAKVIDTLNKEFEAKHPNVTIKRVSRSFNDLKTTLKLALSGKNPPDVVQANQGYPDMGAFVKGGLLRSLDDYSKLYGWDKRYPSSLLAINSFTPDGKTWHTGNLYGLSERGEAVGVFYNKKILSDAGITPPTTYDEFAASLPKLKAAGTVPIAYGDKDLTMGIHLYGVVQASLAGADKVNDLVYAKSGAWTDPDNVKAAQVLQGWAKSGYLTDGANGVSEDQATADFGAGKYAYEVDGPWEGGVLGKAMGTNVGFNALKPNASSAGPVTQGGVSLAWAITSKSQHPDVAAAYINFLNDDHASKEMAEAGLLPTIAPKGYAPQAGTLEADLVKAWNDVAADNGLVPYLDYTTPTFYDTLTAALQNLTDRQTTPEQFAQTLQGDYSKFKASR